MNKKMLFEAQALRLRLVMTLPLLTLINGY